MPRVYLTQAEREQAAAERHQKRMIALLYARMHVEKVRTEDLGKCWGISQAGASYRLRNGLVTIMDIYKAQEILKLDDAEILDLIRGDRDPAGHENGGADAVGSRPRRNGNRQQ